jgi:hemerythrin-like domain-containing protein
LYQKKWRIEALIDNAKSYEDLLNTTIDFENEKLVKVK